MPFHYVTIRKIKQNNSRGIDCFVPLYQAHSLITFNKQALFCRQFKVITVLEIEKLSNYGELLQHNQKRNLIILTCKT